MHLREWLQLADMSPSDFARLAKVNAPIPYKWATGNVSAEAIAMIESITAGEVGAKDFFPEHQALRASRAAVKARRLVSQKLKLAPRVETNGEVIPGNGRKRVIRRVSGTSEEGGRVRDNAGGGSV